MAEKLRVLTHASEILTGAGVREKDGRRPSEEDLGRIEDGALVYSVRKVSGRELPHRVVWVGPTSKLPKKYRKLRVKNLKGRKAVIPGLIDCHTHLVFAGNRAEEFALRCGGMSYEEIARRGGGILTTVRATRAASVMELVRLAVPRVKEAYRHGVRTLEIKSGYGLTPAAELKQLEAVAILRKKFPEITFLATFLGAHAFPPETEISRQSYLDSILETMIPQVARRKLAEACDVFIDRGYFSLEEGRRILEIARRYGLQVKVHADELSNTESAVLATELQALSADHLLKVSDRGVEALSKSRTVAVLLPGTAFYLKEPHAPARRLLSAGARVALATDFNPGTCVTLSLPLIMTLSALYLGMTRAEIFAAVTYNAACALGVQDRKGILERGYDADFLILDFERFEELYYRFGW